MGGEEEEEVGRRKRRSPINMGKLLEKGETVTLWDGRHRSGGEEPERRGVREGPSWTRVQGGGVCEERHRGFWPGCW